MYLCRRKKAGSLVAVSKCSLKILSMYLCRRKKAGSLVAVSKCSITLGGRLTSKKNMCFIMESAIVMRIWTVKRRFNNISKVVNAMCISNIDVRSIGSSDVPMVNSISDTRLVDDHVSNADDALNVRKFHVIGTRWEFTSVSV